MAIRDLLWACPACGVPNALAPASRRSDACRSCGAVLRRGPGANIVLEVPGRAPAARAACDWCADLPAPDPDAEPLDGHATLREAESVEQPLHQNGELLGFIERFRPAVQGVVTLTDGAVRFRSDDGSLVRSWPLERLTAVQPASAALQLKARDQPVVSLRFTSCSVRLWERRIQNALRRLYREAGRGEIVEFQPRISTR